MEPLTTDCYTLPRSAYERYVAGRWLSRRWWVVGVPLAAACAAAAWLSDLRWLLVALIYLFLITPGVLAMAYFRYLLTPMARLTALPKHLVIIPGRSIKVVYESGLPGGGDDAEAPKAPQRPLPPDETIPWTQVRDITLSSGNYVIDLTPTPYPRFLLVPRQALHAPLPLGPQQP